MLLFYTGPDQAGGVQKLPEKSLGGFVSSSIVPNSQFNNLFPKLSKSEVDRESQIIRVIALKNLTGATITGITIYPVLPVGSYIEISMGVAQPFLDGCGNENYEQVSEDSLPYMTTLNIYSQGTPLVFSQPLLANKSIGLFITRSINEDNVPNFDTQGLSCSDNSCCVNVATAITAYEATPKDSQFSIEINW